MTNRIVLISDDSDFFDYIKSKLELRRSDELFTFSFDAVPDKIHLLENAVLIVNSENAREKTLDLLSIFQETPILVTAYNDDDTYRRKCFRAGMLDFIPLLTPDAEFRARMLPALSVAGILAKKRQYRDLLVEKNMLSKNSDVYVDYCSILDKELDSINAGVKKAVFMAVAPNERTKFLLQPSLIEGVILNNIRKNDILMNFAANKYFILLFDTDIVSAQRVWQKVLSQLPEKIYAGFVQVSNQKRQQLINEVLNKLHEAINNEDKIFNEPNSAVQGLTALKEQARGSSNFKMFKQEFGKKIEKVITPVFYQIEQKYLNKLSGVSISHGVGDGQGTFVVRGRYATSSFRITCPGFSKVNVDITFQKDAGNVDTKRITLEPDEFESGLLEDLLEQFILEYMRGCENDS